MEYKGKLYGKIGNKYFDTSHTAEDWDKLTDRIKELEQQLQVSKLPMHDVSNFVLLAKPNYKAKDGTIKRGIEIDGKYYACKGWNGVFDDKAGIGGDCSHLKLDEGFMLEANKVYYGNSQFVHESLPLDKDVHRVMYRITLPINHECKL